MILHRDATVGLRALADAEPHQDQSAEEAAE